MKTSGTIFSLNNFRVKKEKMKEKMKKFLFKEIPWLDFEFKTWFGMAMFTVFILFPSYIALIMWTTSAPGATNLDCYNYQTSKVIQEQKICSKFKEKNECLFKMNLDLNEINNEYRNVIYEF